MTYTTPTPSTVSAGDTFPASAYNIISNNLQDHETRIKTGVESYTTTQKTALTGVTTGTMIYDSTLAMLQVWNGTGWIGFGSQTIIVPTYNIGGSDVANTSPIISFTGATQVLLNNCFTSAYTNYRVIYNQSGCTVNGTVTTSMTIAGTSTGTSNWTGLTSNQQSIAYSGSGSFRINSTSNQTASSLLDVFSPNLVTQRTVITSISRGHFTYTIAGPTTFDGVPELVTATQNYSTLNAHDGIKLTLTGGPVAGNIQVVGMS